jgi:hypothetical protein
VKINSKWALIQVGGELSSSDGFYALMERVDNSDVSKGGIDLGSKT